MYDPTIGDSLEPSSYHAATDAGAGNSRLLHSLAEALPGLATFAVDYSAKAFECLQEMASSLSRENSLLPVVEGSASSAPASLSSAGRELQVGPLVPAESLVADARFLLPLREGCMDLVIDKGCLDAVLNEWDQVGG